MEALSNAFRRTFASQKTPHVGIIGAGVSGLRCADVLLQNNVRVTILEARDRIGGRVAQKELNGHLVDLGSNWIHGTKNNPIITLAEQTKTITHDWDERTQLFDQYGKPLSDEDSEEYSKVLWQSIDDAFRYSESHSDTIPATESLYDFFKVKAKEHYPDEPDAESGERKREIFLQMAELWGAFVGSPVEGQSLKFFWLEKCIDGENLFVAESYHKILEAIKAPVLKNADIELNCPVTKVHGRKGNEEGPVELETKDGRITEFDDIVMTAPLGWMKNNLSVFEPPLPNRIVQAIESVSYGNLDKVYISFPSAFWEGQTESLSRTATGDNTHRTAVNVHATTAPLNQPQSNSTPESTSFPGFIQWLHPLYDPINNPSNYMIECVNYAPLPGSTSQPTLLFYIQGPAAHLIASIVRTVPEADLPKALYGFFKPYIALLPNYDESSEACKPVGVLATAWTNDEYAGYGSYSNFQVGLERGDEDIRVMREGWPEGGIWMAGEHTSDFEALGTVTGAYLSGEKMAERILKEYGLSKGAAG